MTAPLQHGLIVLGVLAGCVLVWEFGGILLSLIGVEELDIPGRVVLVFCFLTACQFLLDRFRKRE